MQTAVQGTSARRRIVPSGAPFEEILLAGHRSRVDVVHPALLGLSATDSDVVPHSHNGTTVAISDANDAIRLEVDGVVMGLDEHVSASTPSQATLPVQQDLTAPTSLYVVRTGPLTRREQNTPQELS